MHQELSALQRRGLLLAYLGSQWPRVLLLVVCLLGGIAMSLVNPQLLGYFIDAARAGEALSLLARAALLFLGVAILGQLFAVAESFVAENLALTTTNRLRADLLLHTLRLDPSFHQRYTPGMLIERIDGDVSMLGNFFSRFMVSLTGNVLLLLAVLVLLFRVDWRVGLILTVFASIALVVLLRLQGIASPFWQRVRQQSAELCGFLEERLTATEDIRSSGAVSYAMRGLYEHSRLMLRKMRIANMVGVVSWSTTSLLATVGTAMALVLGALLFRAGAITLGTVYLLYSYTILLNRPIEQIVTQMQDFQQAVASIGRIRQLLRERSSIEDGPGTSLVDGPLAVAFEDVSFGYVEDKQVLKRFSFTLQPGSVLGLLGRTGSGKTTIARLLLRLYDPTQGTVRLGDVDLRALKLHDLRQGVGMVSQEIQLFHASVRDNVAVFDHSIADERIIRALEELGLGDWYNALPEGLDTELAPGGSGLSAGEAQLLAFARVFLKNPGLVILDEASSRLDPATERLLERAIDRLLEGRTAIIIAHRLATVQRAGRILIVEDGVVCEQGDREALAADSTSRFAHLLRTGLEEVLV